ncbi:hypothetical protein ACJMK2_022705 [Sinanodonta woodiana]|uniref:C-type lectin domain-containing protein n=1 Tax=Sinanodonta woodiana TaxID=1069815 RepID=A0ABD3TL89_SINWO
MSSLWRQIVICFRLYWIWSHVSADGEILENNVRLTWNESLKHCEDNGKVLFDTTKTDYKVTLRKILKGTNKAWVSARVEFSHFVKIPVCMEKSSQLVRYKSYDTDIISNCVNVCNNYWYAGLETIADPIVHGCKECVYAMSTSGVLKIFTESCLGHSADGAICEADRRVIYGVVAVCAVLFVAFVITTIICIFRRRQLSQDRANGCVTHSTIEEHALLEQRISSPSPKPTRKTHTQKEIIDSSYENVIFLRGRQDIATHQLGYSNFEYDKINFDKACVQEIDNTNRDTHVYDHGSLNKTEEQYDVMNMPGDITPIMDETYDRTTV